MRAPIGCTPGTAKTGVMLSEMRGRCDEVMRGAAKAAGASTSTNAATSAAVHGSTREVITSGLFPVFGVNMRIGEPLALELQRRLHLAQRRRLGLASTRIAVVERLEALRQLAQRLRGEVRVVPVGRQSLALEGQALLRE